MTAKLNGSVKFKDSLSKSLLTRVFSIYFIVTLLVTMAHLYIDFKTTQKDVLTELKVVERAFQHSLSAALWNLDVEQIEVTAEGMYEMPSVTGVVVTDSDNEDIFNQLQRRANNGRTYIGIEHSFRLNWGFEGVIHHIGDVKIYSDNSVILSRMEVGIWTLIVSAMVKTTVLLILITWVFNRLLARPLGLLAHDADSIDPNQIQKHRIHIDSTEGNELKVVEGSLNRMMDKVESSMAELDLLNKNLEQKVEQRTSELNSVVIKLESEQQALTNEVTIRKQTEHDLRDRTKALESSLEELRKTQNQLVESEKMASLGGLVAGVAHEINTPIGVCLTGITHFEYMIKEVDKAYIGGTLTESSFKRFVKDSKEISETILMSLRRAADLISSFKKVAVDQSHDQVRRFEIGAYLKDNLISLASLTKKSEIKFEIVQASPIEITSYPGAWSQIFTNLVTNVLEHAYDAHSEGIVTVTLVTQGDNLLLTFKDDGKGMPQTTMDQIFEPFYTTNREGGGSGLGLHIVYNIVTQKLKGLIQVDSSEQKGTCFTITTPLRCPIAP